MANINTSWSWAVSTCNRPNVGYSQTYREQQTVNGITYYDCSSFVWYALVAGAFPVIETYGSQHPFTTSDMISVLLSMGFTEVPVSNVWKPGDILWRSGHTEMVYRGRITMGAHSDDVPLDQQVSISTSEPPDPYLKQRDQLLGDDSEVLMLMLPQQSAVTGCRRVH